MAKLSDSVSSNRLAEVRRLLAETKTVGITVRGQEFEVEYLVVPGSTEEESQKPPIFVYPGGNTHLAPCFEHLLFLGRPIILISPLGYGKSSDMPYSLLKSFPLLGAEVALKVLKVLDVGSVEIFVHSNAAPIGAKMVLLAKNYGIEIGKITMANPLGLRWIPRILAALAFPLSGLLSRIASLGHEHPYMFLKDAYRAPKHPLSARRILSGARGMLYELDKSSRPQLIELLREIRNAKLRVSVTLVQSLWDWASLHWPCAKSNEQIFQQYIPADLLKVCHIAGLHNSTLGKDSKLLAKAMEFVPPLFFE